MGISHSHLWTLHKFVGDIHIIIIIIIIVIMAPRWTACFPCLDHRLDYIWILKHQYKARMKCSMVKLFHWRMIHSFMPFIRKYSTVQYSTTPRSTKVQWSEQQALTVARDACTGWGISWNKLSTFSGKGRACSTILIYDSRNTVSSVQQAGPA